MAQQSISIVGAGLAGLTLSQCLVKRGIPVILYERGGNSSRHSYAITLHATTYRPLLKALDMDEPTFKSRVAVDAATGGVGAIDVRKAIQPGHIVPGSFRAHRGRLETLLREGLEVRWGHTVDSVAADPSGLFTCRDSTRSEEHCIIGADGVHAKTRTSLLPSVHLKILPFVAFNGRRNVKRDVFRRIYAPALEGSNIVEARKDGALLHVSVNDVTTDDVNISWIYSRAARGPLDPLFKPNRPLSAATDTPSELYDEIQSLTDLTQPFKDVFDVDKLKSERILSWLMRTVDVNTSDLEELASKRIFLIGDAVHAQPILGGEGANVAMTDAIQVAEEIVTGGIGAVATWQRSRLSAWREGVDRSKRNIEEMHSDKKASL